MIKDYSKAILVGEKGTIVVDIAGGGQILIRDGAMHLPLSDKKSIIVPRNMTVLAHGLDYEEINDLARNLSGDNPINHFSITEKRKLDLSDMLDEDVEEKESKTKSLDANIF